MCDCLTAVNEKLKEHNTAVKIPWTFGGGPARVLVATEKADKDVRKKPTNVFASYCPFCGEKYEAA